MAKSGPRGQTLVEFALVLPIFILLVFGLIDVGRLVFVNNAISEGAREGARWGAVQTRSMNVAGRTAIAEHTVGIMTGVPAPAITVTCRNSFGVVETRCVTNDFLTVEVRTQVDLLTPVIGQLLGRQTYTATAQVTVAY